MDVLSSSFYTSSPGGILIYRMLQEFVEENGSQLKVIYSLSGWLKNNPEAYHVKLVLGSKLSG